MPTDTAQRLLDEAPHRLWRAWSEPHLLARWWPGPGSRFDCDHLALGAGGRIGGRWTRGKRATEVQLKVRAWVREERIELRSATGALQATFEPHPAGTLCTVAIEGAPAPFGGAAALLGRLQTLLGRDLPAARWTVVGATRIEAGRELTAVATRRLDADVHAVFAAFVQRKAQAAWALDRRHPMEAEGPEALTPGATATWRWRWEDEAPDVLERRVEAVDAPSRLAFVERWTSERRPTDRPIEVVLAPEDGSTRVTWTATHGSVAARDAVVADRGSWVCLERAFQRLEAWLASG